MPKMSKFMSFVLLLRTESNNSISFTHMKTERPCFLHDPVASSNIKHFTP